MWGNHVSDWEHITVRLEWGVPTAVYLAGHDFGTTCDWYSFSKTNQTHPIIYSAWGSHGCWTNAGAYQYKFVMSVPLVDYCTNGLAWNTWERVQAFDFYAQKGLGTLQGTTWATNQWPAWMSDQFTEDGTGDPFKPGNGLICRWGNPWDSVPGNSCIGEWLLNNGPTGPISKGVWNTNRFE